MYPKFSKMNCLTLVTIFCLTACASPGQQPGNANSSSPPGETVRICDENGCADRPKGYATFKPGKNAQNNDPDGRIAALEQMAARDPRAAYDLALRYFRGDGVRQDSYKSIKWMREAGERGNLDAQKALGRLYLTGMEELGADPSEAQKWLSIAASKGDKESADLLQQATVAHIESTSRISMEKSLAIDFFITVGIMATPITPIGGRTVGISGDIHIGLAP